MNTIELQHIMNHGPWLKHLHGRVLAKNLLPQKKDQKTRAFIVNTDNSDQPGTHWVVVYFSESGNSYYFDSYGLPPLHEEITQFLNQNSVKPWTSNHQRVQSLFSSLCGMYCVFALDTLSRGYDIQQYLRHKFYNTDYFHNDQLVIQWFQQNYGILYTNAQRQSVNEKCQTCSPKHHHHEMTVHFPCLNKLNGSHAYL